MVIAKIHNVFKNLTPAEQKVASFILKFPQKVTDTTIKELAGCCGVAPSAVNRMCKSVGAGGFSDLKLSLAGELAKENQGNELLPFKKGDSSETIFSKVFSSGINTLKNTYSMLDIKTGTAVAKAISKAGKVYIFGVGTSSVIAMDASYRFSQLGVQCYAYTDILQISVMANNMKKGDVALGISHSGTTKIIVDAMRTAKKAGATTIALTSFSKSLLYKESDMAVSVYADEENYPVEAVSARIAHMCVVDALMMTIASFEHESYTEHISTRNKALDKIRY